MKTLVGAAEPQNNDNDPYRAYRVRYTDLMRQAARAQRKALTFAGRREA